ncbi:uncharacterized protein LOC113597531 isoform X1 [Acinonyx jubatus]|uniref:Uncharacterized protein LOC113597531 isoform X1 n=1 Tax=Acinonyx jubatus TaxID=32536 RepID=A0ABM3PIJ6_ACIJB|nr:uncharacterized protein LOC113597531 isoform X1 [Acinonyx jubatus]
MLYSRFSRLTLQLRIYITLQEPLPEKITALNSLVEPMQPLLPALKAAASSLPSTSLLGPVLLIYELEVGKWKFKAFLRIWFCMFLAVACFSLARPTSSREGSNWTGFGGEISVLLDLTRELHLPKDVI